MTCRESGLTSAATTIARCMTGLEDRQILSLSHRLQNEFGGENGGTPPTREEWNAYISDMVSQLSRRELYITAGSSDPAPRLERARLQPPSRERYEAARRILAVATAAQRRQEEFFQQRDRRAGATDGTSAARFRELSSDSSTPVPPREWREQFLAQATMPTDSRSMAAYYAMGYNVETETTTTYPVVRRNTVEGSSFLLEEGYDPASGRFEVVMRSNPDRVYAYRLPGNVYQEFSGSRSPGSYYSRNIRGNRYYQYGTAEESVAAGVSTRCGTCGQFENANTHSCPVTGSPEEQNVEVERIVAQRRGTPAPSVPQFLSSGVPHSSYVFPGRRLGSFNMPSSGTVQANIPVGSDAYMFVSATGMSGDATVRGYVKVEHPQDDEWSATIPTSSLGRGRQILACTCVQYQRNRTCSHVDAVTAAIQNKLSSPEYSTEHVEMVQRAAARAQQIADAEVTPVTHTNWRRPQTSFSDDPALFQSFYSAAKADYAAYQSDPENNPFPVPYYEGKAFGGVGSRESGRGFGIEIEYDYPDTMSYQNKIRANANIGRALHAAGLTVDTRQRGYGATHGQVRYNHQGGWSFESDPTTSGEIVSPICYDEADTWENIKKITDILAENGAVASRRCGMHIHVGTKDYNGSIDTYVRLMKTVKENEDLLYRMSAEPKRGTHRGTGYCRPNAESVPSRYHTITDVRYAHSGHHLSMNLQAVTGRASDNVEFRTFDASLEPGVIQAQIGFALYMAEGAKRDDLPMPTETHALGEKRSERRGREPLRGEAWKASTAGARQFIDKFLPGTTADDRENPQIRQFVSLFTIGKWQSAQAARW